MGTTRLFDLVAVMKTMQKDLAITTGKCNSAFHGLAPNEGVLVNALIGPSHPFCLDQLDLALASAWGAI
jgi:hypothetical protein